MCQFLELLLSIVILMSVRTGGTTSYVSVFTRFRERSLVDIDD